MAKKIAVYGVSGSLETGGLKKSDARRMVRQLYACWVVENVSIQRLSIRDFRPFSSPHARHTPAAAYIPEKMPPVEVPGVRFIPPVGLVSWFPPAEMAVAL